VNYDVVFSMEAVDEVLRITMASSSKAEESFETDSESPDW